MGRSSAKSHRSICGEQCRKTGIHADNPNAMGSGLHSHIEGTCM